MPRTWMIDCTVFDYFNEWEHERILYTSNLIGHYYSGLPNLHEKSIDLWNELPQVPHEVEYSDLIVFQNCFNDCPSQKYEILKRNVNAIWRKMSPNSLMVIIDLNFSSIVSLLRQIEWAIAESDGKILLPLELRDAPLNNCKLLSERLYIGTDMIPRKHSWYWSLAMQKR